MEMIESICKNICQVCFSENIDDDRKEFLHTSLLDHIKDILLKNEFDVCLEKLQIFSYLKIKDNSVSLRQGRIDLVADKGDFIIGIEFDSGMTLKYKSIQKLIESDCNACFGIVRGNKTMSDDHNIQRIEQKRSDIVEKNKVFFLINISQKSIINIQ